jgi:glycosyltransferase involved in cell wall biosynthesis
MKEIVERYFGDSVAETGTKEFGSHQARPAKVLLVAPRVPPYGGMALQAELLARLLCADGHRVLYFGSNFGFPRGLRSLEEVPGVRTLVRHLLIWPKLWVAAGGVDVAHVLAASWLYFFAVVAPAVIVGKIRRRRVILNYRGGDAERFLRRWGFAARRIIRMADAVTAPSQFLAGLIHRYCGVPVTIVSNILDQSLFSFRDRPFLRPRLVVARQLEEIYDIESVLRAFRVIRERHPDASLAVVGGGSQKERLRSVAAGWQLQGVTFWGAVAHDDLPRIYADHDIFINASRVDNFPGALLEASAAGLALVSTAAGGIPFMYRHERDALLVTPGDWQALAGAVGTLLASPALARKLIRNGLALAQSCDWRSVRQGIYDSYGLSAADNRRTVEV